MDSEEAKTPSQPPPSDDPPSPPTPAAPAQPSQQPPPPQPPLSSAASTSSSPPSPDPPAQLQASIQQPRPQGISSIRPQPAFSHLPPSSSSVPPSSSSAPSSVPRVGIAGGLHAHHMRAHQPHFAPSSPFSQPFGGLPRPPPPEPSPSSSQVRQNAPGIQTIGMIGSLSPGSQMRPTGAPGQLQQRLGSPAPRTGAPLTNQTLNAQRFQSHGLPRSPSTATSTSSLGSQSPQTLQQQWVSAQGKEANAVSLSSISHRPHMKQLSSQQRHNLSQQQQSQPESSQQPMTAQQQQPQNLQQQPASMSNQHQENQSTQHVTSKGQQPLATQPAARAQTTAQQKTTAQASNCAAPPVSIAPNSVTDPESSTRILTKRNIRELMAQVDPSEKLDPDVENVMMEIADDFVDSVTTFACTLAKHRRSTTLETKDVLLHVEKFWNITLPGFGGDEIKCYKKQHMTDIHKERLSVIKKSMAVVAAGDTTAATKAPASAQAAARAQAAVSKLPG